MLIYLSDSTEIQMQGGDLLLHAGAVGSPVTRVTPQHNRMVCFPCMSRSYHSVTPITSLIAPRNYIQVHISSSVDAWASPAKHEHLPARKTAVEIKPRFKSWPGVSGADREYKSRHTATATATVDRSELSVAPSGRLELEASRAKLLAAIDGATDITVIRNPGNIGDHLIHAGTRRLLAGIDYREVSLREIDDVSGKLAIVTGSGRLV